MGEQGNLYRINPYEKRGAAHDDNGAMAEIRTRLWAKPVPHSPAAHSFVVRNLERTPGSELTEPFALVSTAGRIAAWGLVTHTTRVFEALKAGEEILADARDRYQLIDATAAHCYCLTRDRDSSWLLEANLLSGEAIRHLLTSQHLSPHAQDFSDGHKAPFCGPAIVDGRVVTWSSRELLVLAGGALEHQPLPPGVELWTAPAEDSNLRIPLGTPPCMVVGSLLFLPCNHYGEPALLRAQATSSGWAVSTIPFPRGGGTLSQDSQGNPLLATAGRLYRSDGNSFREIAVDAEMSPRFAGFHAAPLHAQELSIFFCEGDYGVRSHSWLKAHSGEAEQRVNWSPSGNQVLKECGGFWMVGGALVAELLVEDRRTATEFLSWYQ